MRSLIFLLSALFFCAGCTLFLPNPPCPPPASARIPITDTYSCTNPTVSPIIPDGCDVLGLSDLVDLALLNSPKTRASWYRAKQAAADLGTARGAYLPPIFFQGYWLKEQFPVVNLGTIAFLTRQKLINATFSTSYLLFDFGGRNANLMEAHWALDSLNWSFNWEIQSVMIQTIQSYYNYINALAIVEADEATVEDNQTTLNAAVALREGGVRGLSDELQARTMLIQSQIILEQDKGILNVAKATLVQSLGLPPDTPLSVSLLPEEIEVDGICQDMATLMQLAKENRDDLRATRARVMENLFQIRSARSQMLPTISTDLVAGKQSVNNLRFLNVYSIQFNLNVPIFNSFSDINEIRKAQAVLLESQANLDDEELIAFLSVLSDYYELIANTQILKYSKTYIEIAKKNREVAFANYKAGITTIIDVMTANNALNVARVQMADAKTNFLTSLANLSFDTGGLKVSDIRYDESVRPCENMP